MNCRGAAVAVAIFAGGCNGYSDDESVCLDMLENWMRTPATIQIDSVETRDEAIEISFDAENEAGALLRGYATCSSDSPWSVEITHPARIPRY